MMKHGAWVWLVVLVGCHAPAPTRPPLDPDALRLLPQTRLVPLEAGWAANSVNSVIFRQHALTTFADTQYTAFYTAAGRIRLAKRHWQDSTWTISETALLGEITNAHNAISLAVDGAGFLHMVWGLHGKPLQYVRSLSAGSFDMVSVAAMTGVHEDRMTYPEFYNLPNGDLVFMYRDGQSGDGDTYLNRYDVRTQQWSALQHPLLSGEGVRNAYTNQLAIGQDGVWHLSWNWRESSAVESNHDLLYARSRDEGQTWETSSGQPYVLPITQASAEVIVVIPQGRSYINHTSMTVAPNGTPLIASYWQPEGGAGAQYHVVFQSAEGWEVRQVSNRQTPFVLRGRGTKRIPISRPQILSDTLGRAYILFRDWERGGVPSVAIGQPPRYTAWETYDLAPVHVNAWEPNVDALLWQQTGILHLLLQNVGQGDGETLEAVEPQMISVLEWSPSSMP